MTKGTLLLIPLTFFLILSCNENTIEEIGSGLIGESNADKPFPGVDDRLWEIFQEFETEAKTRGIAVDLADAGITGSISTIEEDGVVGYCSYGRRRSPNHIEIDDTFWRRASSVAREYIVFHELGHCYLYREHLEDCFANRTWVSLMRSGTLTTCRDNYNSATRGYYIDELFGVEIQ